MAGSYKNNIFDILNHIDYHDYNYFDSLSEEQQKDFTPFLILRWLSCSSDQSGMHMYHLLTTSQMNKNLWKISNEKKLCYMLFASTGLNRKCYHKWIKLTNKQSNNNSLSKLEKEIQTLFDVNDIEAKIIVKEMGLAKCMDFLKQNGYSDKEIKLLLKNK